MPYPAPRGTATRLVRFFLTGGDRAVLVRHRARGRGAPVREPADRGPPPRTRRDHGAPARRVDPARTPSQGQAKGPIEPVALRMNARLDVEVSCARWRCAIMPIGAWRRLVAGLLSGLLEAWHRGTDAARGHAKSRRASARGARRSPHPTPARPRRAPNRARVRRRSRSRSRRHRAQPRPASPNPRPPGRARHRRRGPLHSAKVRVAPRPPAVLPRAPGDVEWPGRSARHRRLSKDRTRRPHAQAPAAPSARPARDRAGSRLLGLVVLPGREGPVPRGATEVRGFKAELASPQSAQRPAAQAGRAPQDAGGRRGRRSRGRTGEAGRERGRGSRSSRDSTATTSVVPSRSTASSPSRLPRVRGRRCSTGLRLSRVR